MAPKTLALYGSWRRSIANRLFVSSADTQARPAREQNTGNGRNRRKLNSKPKAVIQAVGEPNLQPQRGHRTSRKRCNEKRIDPEFDMVIVTSDGISVSGSDTDHSDWSIGWFEPHGKQFTDDEEDSFAALMPCYGAPSPPLTTSRKSFSPNQEQKPPVWATMLANLSRQPSTGFIGIRDDEATRQLKLCFNNLQEMEDSLPMTDEYKFKDVTASPIRVIQSLYNCGDMKGPQTVAFNLPNVDRMVKELGTAMVMLKNISQVKFDCILKDMSEQQPCTIAIAPLTHV